MNDSIIDREFPGKQKTHCKTWINLRWLRLNTWSTIATTQRVMYTDLKKISKFALALPYELLISISMNFELVHCFQLLRCV